MSGSIIPERSVEDILAERIRVVLAGTEYSLPVLPRAANRRWLESLDGRLRGTLAGIDSLDDTTSILAALVGASEAFLPALVEYDTAHVLPPVETIEETATDLQIMRAVLEVWQAANPLADIALVGARPIAGTPSGRTSSPPRNGAGRRGRSKG